MDLPDAFRTHPGHRLNRQIDLLAEREITRLLQMQIEVCKHLGITSVASHPETQELSQDTAVENVAAELREP